MDKENDLNHKIFILKTLQDNRSHCSLDKNQNYFNDNGEGGVFIGRKVKYGKPLMYYLKHILFYFLLD